MYKYLNKTFFSRKLSAETETRKTGTSGWGRSRWSCLPASPSPAGSGTSGSWRWTAQEDRFSSQTSDGHRIWISVPSLQFYTQLCISVPSYEILHPVWNFVPSIKFCSCAALNPAMKVCNRYESLYSVWNCFVYPVWKFVPSMNFCRCAALYPPAKVCTRCESLYPVWNFVVVQLYTQVRKFVPGMYLSLYPAKIALFMLYGQGIKFEPRHKLF
jgi:hypothetical protein